MRAASAGFLLAFFLVSPEGLHAASANVASKTRVTVLLDFDQSPGSVRLDAMRRELQGLLEDAGIAVDLRLKRDLPPNPQFNDLVIFKMKGACTMNALPVGALSDERGALAMTYTSDGELLPFGEVECDRVRESLQRVFGRGNPEEHQITYSAALARVIAHEMYHMISNSKTHTKKGVTKESLSSRELAEGIQFSPKADAALRQGLAEAAR